MKRKKNNEVTDNQKIKEERRTFLKKAAYKAPALIVLGALAKPTTADANLGSPPPPSGKGFGQP